jgi:hypothetical protein
MQRFDYDPWTKKKDESFGAEVMMVTFDLALIMKVSFEGCLTIGLS